MGNHIIKVNPLNPLSFLKARVELEMIRRLFKRQVNEFIHELGRIGQETAQACYGDSITVTLEDKPNGVVINANGRGIIFLEFGAGDATNSSHKYADRMEFDIRPGSYSEINFNPQTLEPWPSYHIHGFWIFGQTVFREVQPTNAMEHVYEAIHENMEEVARRVFV